MKTKLYNIEGKASGNVELNDNIFNVEVKPEVLHEVYTIISSNQREPWAHTKGKGDVSGGGKKPWKQKGTGRARHGSIRSPLWVGGGVTFGPVKERNYDRKVNKKAKRAALKMGLSDRASSDAIYVIENYNFSDPKTKTFASLIKNLEAKQKNFLVLTALKDDKVIRMTANLKKVETMRAADLNVYDLLNHQAIIASKEAIAKIEEILSK